MGNKRLQSINQSNLRPFNNAVHEVLVIVNLLLIEKPMK